jgi:hypothetical protein
MPPTTKMRTFIHSIKTRKTHTTNVLDAIFRDPAHAKTYVNMMNRLNTADALDDPIVDWAFPANWPNKPLAVALYKHGLTQRIEYDHLQAWLDAMDSVAKNTFRQKLYDTVTADKSLEFFWELTNEQDEAIADDNTSPNVRVFTFKSPRSKVTLHTTDDDVTVSVGNQIVIE